MRAQNASVADLVIRTIKQPTWLGIEHDDALNEWLNDDGKSRDLPVYFRWMFFTKGLQCRRKNARTVDFQATSTQFWKIQFMLAIGAQPPQMKSIRLFARRDLPPIRKYFPSQ